MTIPELEISKFEGTLLGLGGGNIKILHNSTYTTGCNQSGGVAEEHWSHPASYVEIQYIHSNRPVHLSKMYRLSSFLWLIVALYCIPLR